MGPYGSGSRLISRLISKRVSDFVHETFESENILQELAFVSLFVGHAACRVQLKSLALVPTCDLELKRVQL